MSHKHNSSEQPDGNVVVAGIRVLKTLDANRYATKKTIAQGLLDVALLTANASQLKYVLQVGKQHEFYTLMLSLIIVSIVLQVTAAVLSIIMATLTIHHDSKQNTIAEILNHVALGFVTGALFCDIIKMNFGLDPAVATLQALLCIFLGIRMDINKESHHNTANWTNNIVLGINVIVFVVNIVIEVFKMSSDSYIITTS